MADPLSDAMLLDRFVSGREETAFAELVRRYHVRVRATCRRALGTDQDADDVAQATFLTLATKAGETAWRDSVEGWLHVVAKRLARDARQSATRRKRREIATSELPESPQPRSDPAEDAERRELRRIVQQELKRLPEKYREPVVLCDLEGLSHAEAADRLGLPSGSMSRRLGKARSILRSRLASRLLPLASALLVVSLVGFGLVRRFQEGDGSVRTSYRLALSDDAEIRRAAAVFEGHAQSVDRPSLAFLKARQALRLATVDLDQAFRAGDLTSSRSAARRLDATCVSCHHLASRQ
ncbi:MAG: RNA polymerase sigma factor [Isosphaeraceae bacterium]